MVNKKQSIYMRRNTQLKTFFNKNMGIISGYGPFSNEVSSFFKNFDLAEDAINGKNTTGIGITSGKDILKTMVAETGGDTCRIARSYAAKTGNAGLLAIIDYSYSDILKQKDIEVLPVIIRIYNALKPLTSDELFVTYGIAKEKLEAMLDEAKKFNGMLGEAAVVDADSNVANKNLNELLGDMNSNVDQLDLLIPHFKTNEPGFVTGFEINARINDSGVHHSGFQGIIRSEVTGKPVAGAVVVLQGTNKKAVSNLNGGYELIKIQSKEFRVIVTAEGYEPKTFTIKIQRGKIILIDITL